MASLSRIAKRKKKMNVPTIRRGDSVPTILEEKRDQSAPVPIDDPDFVGVHIPECEDMVDDEDPDCLGVIPFDEKETRDEFEQIVFISDTKLTKKLRKKLDEYENIKDYDFPTFQNRTFENLSDLGIKFIWVYVGSKQARRWLGENINKNDHFTVVLAYKVKYSKWIDSLKEYSKIVCKVSQLDDLQSINQDEFGDKLNNFVEIAGVVSPILKCIGLQNRLLTKSQKNN